jgi:aspartate aminotransferase-like enzyme
MEAYEKGTPAYFATPPVNLIYAYHEALSQILHGSMSLEERIKKHVQTSKRIKQAAAEIGLKQVPVDPEASANGMTAVRLSYLSLSLQSNQKFLKLSYPSCIVRRVLNRQRLCLAF